jgi:hypothetical protein
MTHCNSESLGAPIARYQITRSFFEQFEKEGRPFLSFDQYDNLVRKYRDEHYAVECIESFSEDVGRRYNLWTVETQNRYFQNLFFNQIKAPLIIEFSIPNAQRKASFPLSISVYKDGDLVFTQKQIIAVQKIVGNKAKTVGWRKIAPIQQFVSSQIMQW